MKKDRRGTWPQALWAFAWPILLLLGLRWAVVEPYVIPSGSMIPNLLIHDHILVHKFSFGLRWPFSDRWILRWSEPQAGDTIVFRAPETPSVFFIKRLIGRPGDRIRLEGHQLSVNDQIWTLEKAEPPVPAPEDSESFEYFWEQSPLERHLVRWSLHGEDHQVHEWVVPEGTYFFMGDNRDQSSDSRSWGSVPEQNLVGKAWLIWLSCEDMLESAPFLCHPSTLRWGRIMSRGGL